ncbi:MAG: hypothetical protein ACHQUB_00990 [Candidatus Saccharimonadia bacterium]
MTLAEREFDETDVIEIELVPEVDILVDESETEILPLPDIEMSVLLSELDVEPPVTSGVDFGAVEVIVVELVLLLSGVVSSLIFLTAVIVLGLRS